MKIGVLGAGSTAHALGDLEGMGTVIITLLFGGLGPAYGLQPGSGVSGRVFAGCDGEVIA